MASSWRTRLTVVPVHEIGEQGARIRAHLAPEPGRHGYRAVHLRQTAAIVGERRERRLISVHD
jgi:hypothetical protein